MSKKITSSSMNDSLLNIGRQNRLIAKIIAQAEYFILPFVPSLKRKVDSAITTYLPAGARKNKKRIARLRKDMLFSRMYYEISFNQYFLFDFEKKTHIGRREFVGDHEKARYTDHLHKSSDLYHIFRNKYQTYQTFKPFYKRDIVRINDLSEKDDFIAFVKKHPRFILKIEDEALGNGINIVDLSESGESPEEFYTRILSDGKTYLAEELIAQITEMASLHPSSVNTVRFATYLKDGKVKHMFSFLRIGSGGSIIDNATSGGISAAIDMKTGIVTTPGYSEDKKCFLLHPDTGVKIIGMQIPCWDELLNLVDELAKVVPQQQYVGWDLALTKNGWVMVEGNDSAMMTAIQMCEKKGLRRVFDAAFKK